MLFEDVVRNLPLLTAILSYSIVVAQVWRDRTRTWTETFFIFGYFFIGTYALSDFFYFHSPSEAASVFAAKVGLSALTLANTFLFLFTAVFLGRMKRRHLALLIPCLLLMVAIWTSMVRNAEDSSWGWQVNYRAEIFAIWIAYVSLTALGGIVNLLRTSKIVRAQSKSLGVRTLVIALSFAFDLLAGLSTNAAFEMLGLETMPMFSTLLLAPVIAQMLVLFPMTWQKWTNAMKNWGSRRYEIKGAYLIYMDGTLIASKSVFPKVGVDLDIFSATLDVIQNFMRTSFPYLSGKWLKAIDHGDMRIIIERGKHVYLALVLTGEENDLLRREMTDIIASFEERNESTLVSWRGMAQDASGTDDALGTFFAKEALF